MSAQENEKPLWRPSRQRVAEANMTAFLQHVRDGVNGTVESYEDLRRWSVADPAAFWWELWDHLGVVGEKGDRAVDDLDRMPGAKWFPRGHLNFAENLLRHDDDRPALVATPEAGPRRTLTHAELRREVSRAQQAFRELGVGPGDRVAGYLPNTLETVVAMLGAASLGAVWSSCSPDFGTQAARDRLGQIEPKVLVAADGYHYARKPRPVLDRVRDLSAAMPSLAATLVLSHLSEQRADLSGIEGAEPWEEFVRDRRAAELSFEQLPFDHPVYVMYSSGTTGLPKAIVHGAGGTLLQHLKELVLHTNLRRGDRIAYFTTCGWMMWNWLVSSLAVGSTVGLIDGSPFHPEKSRLFDLAEDEGTTVLGVSAKYLALVEKHGVKPTSSHQLPALRAILSTGSPLAPESFDYVYRDVKRDLQLASISGGTDLISCFALGNPVAPVWRGELQTRGLGMAVEVYDEKGRSLPPGEKGELVCTRPFPSMPVGFWNDPEGVRYRAAYFEHFPGVWRHGDWVELSEHGGMVFHGRSDTTLNPGGIRIGTAEIYRVVESIDEVLEAVVVGQRQQDDERVLLFVHLREGAVLDTALRELMRSRIRSEASPHHVPKVILEVPGVPRTVSGKVSEAAVRRAVHGESVDNRDALANPEVLDAYRDRPELIG